MKTTLKDNKLYYNDQVLGTLTDGTIDFNYDVLVKMLLSQTKLFRDKKLGTGGTKQLIEQSGEIAARTYDTDQYQRSEIEGLEHYIQNMREENGILKEIIKSARAVHDN